jgi:lysophospholipase L1-like esterase
MVRIFGDSITAGVPGVSYCRFFKGLFPYKAHGVGGDTVSGLLNRMNRYAVDADDVIVIEIGTNDIMLPHLSTLSISWKKVVQRIADTGRVPAASIEDFQEKYSELLFRFKPHTTIAASIPCIGENINSDVNRQVDRYNRIIKKLCKSYKCCYVDFNAWQKEAINQSACSKNAYLLGEKPYTMLMDVPLTKYFRQSDRLSIKRGLFTTIDGVHLNTHGAKLLADMIFESLKQNDSVLYV